MHSSSIAFLCLLLAASVSARRSKEASTAATKVDIEEAKLSCESTTLQITIGTDSKEYEMATAKWKDKVTKQCAIGDFVHGVVTFNCGFMGAWKSDNGAKCSKVAPTVVASLQTPVASAATIPVVGKHSCKKTAFSLTISGVKKKYSLPASKGVGFSLKCELGEKTEGEISFKCTEKCDKNGVCKDAWKYDKNDCRKPGEVCKKTLMKVKGASGPGIDGKFILPAAPVGIHKVPCNACGASATFVCVPDGTWEYTGGSSTCNGCIGG